MLDSSNDVHSVALVQMEQINNLKFIADSETLSDINPLTFPPVSETSDLSDGSLWSAVHAFSSFS